MQQMLLDKKSPENNKAHVNKKKWAHLEVQISKTILK